MAAIIQRMMTIARLTSSAAAVAVGEEMDRLLDRHLLAVIISQ